MHDGYQEFLFFTTGRMTDVSQSMAQDQFGMAGLLPFIQAKNTDPNVEPLNALDIDLTTLGLYLNSPDCLYLTFGGPWSDTQDSSVNPECSCVPEYLFKVIPTADCIGTYSYSYPYPYPRRIGFRLSIFDSSVGTALLSF